MYRLDLSFSLGAELLHCPEVLNAIEDGLLLHAPSWSSALKDFSHDRPIARGAMASHVVALSKERSKFYRQLDRMRPSKPVCVSSNIELRGSDRSLIVCLDAADRLFIPRPEKHHICGNHLTIQVCRKTVEGRPAAEWAKETCIGLLGRLPVWHAYAALVAEYEARNMITTGGCVEGLGWDLSRYLPGLYWLNAFAEPYVQMIGQDRFEAAPFHSVSRVGVSLVCILGKSPDQWPTEEYDVRRNAVLDQLGREFFFDREHPDRMTRAPRFPAAEPQSGIEPNPIDPPPGPAIL